MSKLDCCHSMEDAIRLEVIHVFPNGLYIRGDNAYVRYESSKGDKNISMIDLTDQTKISYCPFCGKGLYHEANDS